MSLQAERSPAVVNDCVERGDRGHAAGGRVFGVSTGAVFSAQPSASAARVMANFLLLMTPAA